MPILKAFGFRQRLRRAVVAWVAPLAGVHGVPRRRVGVTKVESAKLDSTSTVQILGYCGMWGFVLGFAIAG